MFRIKKGHHGYIKRKKRLLLGEVLGLLIGIIGLVVIGVVNLRCQYTQTASLASCKQHCNHFFLNHAITSCQQEAAKICLQLWLWFQ